jgi:hypothetical protein
MNVSYSKVEANVYLLCVQQIFGTARAILTRNDVMNHHVQRELTMAEKCMFGNLKLLLGYKHAGLGKSKIVLSI